MILAAAGLGGEAQERAAQTVKTKNVTTVRLSIYPSATRLTPTNILSSSGTQRQRKVSTTTHRRSHFKKLLLNNKLNYHNNQATVSGKNKKKLATSQQLHRNRVVAPLHWTAS